MRPLLLAALLVACKKEPPPPTCEQISDHMLDVTKQAMPGHDPSYLGDRTAMIAQCEKRKLTRDQRNCLMKASTLPALGDCTPKKPVAPAAPTSTPPSAVPSTGSGSP